MDFQGWQKWNCITQEEVLAELVHKWLQVIKMSTYPQNFQGLELRVTEGGSEI